MRKLACPVCGKRRWVPVSRIDEAMEVSGDGPLCGDCRPAREKSALRPGALGTGKILLACIRCGVERWVEARFSAKPCRNCKRAYKEAALPPPEPPRPRGRPRKHFRIPRRALPQNKLVKEIYTVEVEYEVGWRDGVSETTMRPESYARWFVLRVCSCGERQLCGPYSGSPPRRNEMPELCPRVGCRKAFPAVEGL